ncbi:MAG: hypothetical protein HY765_09410 [Rhodomicrobium sp.]|nr:hypothetical protein [Rhodomicrobium sp.]
MRAFRMLAVLLILLCLVPPLSLLTATLIARSAGCGIDPDTPVTCQILGGDYGDILYQLTHFGWYAVETLPILGALLLSWLLIEIIRVMNRPRKPVKPQTLANSRNRARGS